MMPPCRRYAVVDAMSFDAAITRADAAISPAMLPPAAAMMMPLRCFHYAVTPAAMPPLLILIFERHYFRHATYMLSFSAATPQELRRRCHMPLMLLLPLLLMLPAAYLLIFTPTATLRQPPVFACRAAVLMLMPLRRH